MSFPRQVVPGRVYLVTRRCAQRQFLLRPDDETNNAFIYCFAYAAKRTQIEVIAFLANSNHYHAVVIDVEGRIPRFLETFHRLLAKHQNVLRGRRENVWSSEQTSLVELVGDDDVLAKTVYTLCNPVKDHLVARATEWPGASSLSATLHDVVVTARRPRRFFRANGALPETVALRCVRPPQYVQVTDAEYRALLEGAIQQAERDAEDDRRRTGRTVLGRENVLSQSPTDSPSTDKPRRTIDPRVAARDKGARAEAIRNMKSFRAEYFAARQRWLAGLDAVFPEGTWWLRQFAAVACEPRELAV